MLQPSHPMTTALVTKKLGTGAGGKRYLQGRGERGRKLHGSVAAALGRGKEKVSGKPCAPLGRPSPSSNLFCWPAWLKRL